MTASHHTYGLTGGWCRWHDGPGDELGTLVAQSCSGPPLLIPACGPCRDKAAADAAKESRPNTGGES